ncbi:WYL domain-containing protein [Ferrimonas balearica]|uniref:WYL domain-containing protein n=1 Tax=Ferrimonas balearica TaxID=44012 RepID=UPI001F1BEED4|nr:WYL domain-containing protein [Ferrimonas balearica]MBY6093947.1 WYL domain-containing protein [Ferrimonas balearica]
MDSSSLKLDLQLRFRVIEIIALWEGRLTTNHLCQAFGIGRQQASKDINHYLNDFAEGELVYDRSLKGYKPTTRFRPKFCEGHAHEYLQLLDRHDDLGGVLSFLSLKLGGTQVLDVPSRYVDPQVVRTLVQAARDGLAVDVHYDSLSSESPEDDPSRLLQPHTLVFNGFRWHVRAWCEKNQAFRDFVISRFRGPAVLDDSRPKVGKELDTDWNNKVSCTLIPNPRLTQRQQEVIAKDNGMELDTLSLTITVPRALLAYYLKRMDVAHPYNPELDAFYQQVVVKQDDAYQSECGHS